MMTKLTEGDKVYFDGERYGYAVRACDKRFAVCTKPFNPRRSVLYTIVDLQENVRGTENLVFGMGAESTEDCRRMLKRLAVGETEVSHRNRVALNITKVVYTRRKLK